MARIGRPPSATATATDTATTTTYYSEFIGPGRGGLKNFALDSLSMNGIYIAGGIAAKNASLFFDPQFMSEFIRCGRQSKQLVAMPVALIADYNVSLYGVVVAAQLRKEGEL